MHWLQSFLEEAERQNTTPKVPSKPSKPGSVGSVGTGTLVYGRECEKAGSVAEVAVADPQTQGADVPGSNVIQLPRRCGHCSKSKDLEGAPAWRRNGKIVKRVWSEAKWDWYCSFCGRGVKE
jgi:hypothetical protein